MNLRSNIKDQSNLKSRNKAKEDKMSFKDRYISQTEKNNGKEIIQKY